MNQPQLALRTLLLLVLICASACTLTPRNEQRITSRTQVFAGYHSQPNERVTLQAYNFRAGRWDSVVSTASSASAVHTDPCGYRWHAWQMTVKLPVNLNSPYWFDFPLFTSNRLMARMLVPSGILFSFDEGADACIQRYECANDILNNCGNPNGEITLFCDDGQCR